MSEAFRRTCASRLRHKVRLAYPCAILLLALVQSCGGSYELSRSRAAELIRQSGEFRAPVSIPLRSQPEWDTKAASADEPEQEARARAVESYAEYFAEVAVLRHLGLVDVKATLIDGPTPRYLFWKYRMEPFLTDKGRLEGGEDPAAAGREAVVVARKELLEVTGITRPRDDTAQVEFTWRQLPTTAGEAFDTTSPTYRELPEALKKIVVRPTSLTGATAERKYGGVKKSTAVLRRYDDDWRVQSIG